MEGLKKLGLAREPLPRRAELPLALVVAGLYALATFFQEKFTACNGFGHDGCNYGTWALDFPEHAIRNKLGSYGIQRALPSLIAWSCLKALHVAPTAAAVVRAFQLMNVALVLLGVFTWAKIARLLGIRGITTLIGAVTMFAAYGVAKFTSWYPVLGDLWGFSFAFVALYAYLTRRVWLFPPLLLVGAFAWPSLPGVVLPLWCLRSVKSDDEQASRTPPLLAASVAACAWLVFTLWNVRKAYWPPALVPVDTMPQVIRLSILIAIAYCFFAIREATNAAALFRPSFYVRALVSLRGTLAVMLLLAARHVQGRWSIPEEAGFVVWIRQTAMVATFKPAVFLVAHIIYFGPPVALLLLRFRSVVSRMRAHGPALLVVGAVAVLFGLDSESRHACSFLAVLLPFGFKYLDDLALDGRALWGFTLASVGFSKLWMTLPPDLPGAAAEFPAQTVFMSQGPWMSNPMYLLQLPVVAMFVLWLHRTLARRERRLARSGLRASKFGDVELGVLREKAIGVGSGDADALGRAEHVAALRG